MIAKTVEVQETTPLTSPSPPGPRRSKQGFASLSIERRREIASLGGRSVPKARRSFSKSKELAAAAGRKGGKAVPPEKRSFSRDRELAKKCGSMGGAAVPDKKRSFTLDSGLAKEAGRKGGLAQNKNIV